MSSARPKPEPRPDRGAAILNELRANARPVTPRDFDFWFAYASGTNPALAAAADQIRTSQGSLTAADIGRLHDQHLSPWRLTEGADAISTRLANTLRALNITLDGAIGETRSQRETMVAEAAELGSSDALTLQRVAAAIEKLVQSTKEGQARCARIEARMAAASREITSLQQQLAAVRTECRTDPLTALVNRAAFDEALAEALEDAAVTRQPVAILLCDLDYFGAFNENFGATAADRVLRTVGALLKGHVREGDIVARFGGDEFAAILPRQRASEAVETAERFRQALMLQDLVKHENGAGRITVSIGIADIIKGDTPTYLLRRAGNGLKVAKAEGRNRVVEMTPDGPVWDAERRA